MQVNSRIRKMAGTQDPHAENASHLGEWLAELSKFRQQIATARDESMVENSDLNENFIGICGVWVSLSSNVWDENLQIPISSSFWALHVRKRCCGKQSEKCDKNVNRFKWKGVLKLWKVCRSCEYIQSEKCSELVFETVHWRAVSNLKKVVKWWVIWKWRE